MGTKLSLKASLASAYLVTDYLKYEVLGQGLTVAVTCAQ